MNRSLGLAAIAATFGALFVFVANIPGNAQDMQVSTDDVSRRGNRALVLDIEARVLENEQEVIWNETHRRFTIPGSPVGLRLVGANIVVVVQFTPFIRRHGNVLVAQGQIWVDDPEKGICYYTSIQTVPMVFGEPIYFFPLGSQQLDSSIEISITVNQNRETDITEDITANANNDR
jgi:hypothetical protein